ncbi:aspartate kinase [Dongshaea marina]|uniref:aspartate kinase n=1 Tax=Dongshaea marina TaxID=2047966 RepID=UPI000D3EBA34|nr:aspartate kinase [Dongshaea marina]
MALYVQKFGGTSVGSLQRIEAVADRICQYRQQGHDIVVVVSAMAGETNRLLGMALELDPQASRREQDVLLSTGEQVSIALLSIALIKRGCAAVSMTGDQVGVRTDHQFGKARILECQTESVQKQLAEGKVVVVAGFQGRDDENNITTLGRGGSDTTAVALAAALKADECQIFTDVDGVYTTDPRVEPKARRLEQITFEEMLEMSALGAKVLQVRSVELAGQYRVPLRVLSSFEQGQGTLISYGCEQDERPLIAGIAFDSSVASIGIQGLPEGSQIAAKLLEPVADDGIDIDMIVQSTGSCGSTELTFTVQRSDYARAVMLTQARAESLEAQSFMSNDSIACVSLVGLGMKHHPGVAKSMFELLGDAGINMQLISTSEIKISVVVDESELQDAVRVLHSGFCLDQKDMDDPEQLLNSA